MDPDSERPLVDPDSGRPPVDPDSGRPQNGPQIGKMISGKLKIRIVLPGRLEIFLNIEVFKETNIEILEKELVLFSNSKICEVLAL